MDKTFTLYFVVPVVLGVVILFAGVVILIITSRRKKQAGEINIDDWETVGGKILSSKIEEHEAKQSDSKGTHIDLTYEPIVEYVYVVNEVEYHGNKVFPGVSEKFGQEVAQEILEKYPHNTYVPVQYNPDNPSESALMPQREHPDYLIMAGYLFTSFGVSVCCFTSLMAFILLGKAQ